MEKQCRWADSSTECGSKNATIVQSLMEAEIGCAKE